MLTNHNSLLSMHIGDFDDFDEKEYLILALSVPPRPSGKRLVAAIKRSDLRKTNGN